MEMTREIASAAAYDAAVKQARENGRGDLWNSEDYNLAVRTFNELWPYGFVYEDEE